MNRCEHGSIPDKCTICKQDQGKVKCKICGNQFRKAGLYLHMNWAHGVIFEEKEK